MKILNTLFFVTMIVINALANTVTIGGNKTGSVSEKYPNLFTPSPVTFSIWGIIYIFVGMFIVYQFTATKEHSAALQDSIRYWFIISCIANIAWIFLWHYEYIELSMIAMLGLLFSLIILNINLGKMVPATIWDRLTIYGFNIYLGWICAATIANVSVMLVKLGWNGFGLPEQFWMVLVILVGTVLGICFALVGNRIFATAAIIWAYAGILLKYFMQGSNKSYPFVVTITILCVLLMAVVMICGIVEKKTVQ